MKREQRVVNAMIKEKKRRKLGELQLRRIQTCFEMKRERERTAETYTEKRQGGGKIVWEEMETN